MYIRTAISRGNVKYGALPPPNYLIIDKLALLCSNLVRVYAKELNACLTCFSCLTVALSSCLADLITNV